MTLALRTLLQSVGPNRASGGTYFNSSGNVVGIDFTTTGAVAASTGAKTYTIAASRGWSVGDPVLVTPEDGTANISMSGVVTGYSGSTLDLNITSVGTDTTTTKTSWRIGYVGPRMDCQQVAPFSRIGFLVEEQKTNSIRNSVATGATNGTLGSGGVLPTNWSFPTTGGLSLDITTGTESGLSGVYLRFYGTTSGTQALVRFGTTTGVTETPGSLWTESLYARISAGTSTNVSSINLVFEEYDSTPTLKNTTTSSKTLTGVLTRIIKTILTETVVGTSSGRLVEGLSLDFSSGVPVDITLFVAGIQLELVRDVTRASTAQAGGASTITLDAGASSTDNFYTGKKILIRTGTGVGQIKTITNYVGSTKVATVDTSWSTQPDATSLFSVYSGFVTEDAASSFIPTKTVAATRSADLYEVSDFATWFTGSSSTEGTIIAEGVAASYHDTSQSASPRLVALNDGTTANDSRIIKTASGSVSQGQIFASNVSQATLVGDSWSPDETKIVALAYKQNSFSLCCDGGSVVTDSSGSVPSGITGLRLGHAFTNTVGPWNGWIKKVRFIPRKLTDAELQAVTSGLQ